MESKTSKPSPGKHKRKPQPNINKTLFDNKAIEFINLLSLIHDPIVRSSIPSNINNFDISPVVINLGKPINSRIFNLTRCVSSFNVKRFVQDNTTFPGNYEGPVFTDQ